MANISSSSYGAFDGSEQPKPQLHHVTRDANEQRPLVVLDNILQHIGNTPLVRLNRIPAQENVTCEILAKCEFFNAGGSVKDRIGLRMIQEAEASGQLLPGDTVIEPTSGNTGIGLALTAAVKGYRTIITLPEKMSQEKVNVLKALGAEIIRTPTEAAWDSPESHISVAKQLQQKIPRAHILDQYGNPYNPIAHYDTTAEEILEACEGRIDMFVAGAGTGGTITGVAKKLKEKCPNCIVVGVDPVGSILAVPDTLNKTNITSYKVEGIGYDFIPNVLERGLVDMWIKTEDKESFTMARRLIRQEGLLCGGSSGSALVGAIKAAKMLKPGQRCVVLLADSVRNYMSKFLADEWMVENRFVDAQMKQDVLAEKSKWGHATIAHLSLPEPVTILDNKTCAEAHKIMQANGFDQLPVISAVAASATPPHNKLVGLVTMGNVLSKMASGAARRSDPVAKVMIRFSRREKYHKVTPRTRLDELTRYFTNHSVAFVTEDPRDFAESGGSSSSLSDVGPGPEAVDFDELRIKSVVSKVDLLDWLMRQQEHEEVATTAELATAST